MDDFSADKTRLGKAEQVGGGGFLNSSMKSLAKAEEASEVSAKDRSV